MTAKGSCALLADPHHGIAESIRILLGTAFDAVVMVADEVSLLETAGRVKPCVAIVDLVLARGNVSSLIARLHERSPSSKVILLSVHPERAVARAVIEAGAEGFVVKGSLGSELIAAIDAVLRGERYVTSPN